MLQKVLTNKLNSLGRKLILSFAFDAVLAIVAGLLILVYPDLLAISVGVFLIFSGLKALIVTVKIKNTFKITLLEEK